MSGCHVGARVYRAAADRGVALGMTIMALNWVGSLLIVALGVAGASPLAAQDAPASGSLWSRLAESAPSLLGTAMPNLGATGASNAAGVLSYCLRNRVIAAATPAPAVAPATSTPAGAPATSTPAGAAAKPAATGGTAASVLSALMKRGVASSKAFSAGQSGQVLTGAMPTLSLSDLGGKAKAKACTMVLKRAKSLL